MTNLRQAAQAVVERWDTPAWEWRDQGPTADLMADLRTALAQPEQEPVAWAVQGCSKMWRDEFAEIDAKAEAKRIGGTCVAYALYTTPPAAQRKPLTATTIGNMMPSTIPTEHDGALMEFARAIEAAHNIKEGT